MTKEEALLCMNRFRNQLHIDGVVKFDDDNLNNKVEKVENYLLDRYYKQPSPDELTEEEKHYLLLFLLSCCTVIDSDYEEHRGEKVATFMDTFVAGKMAELIQKASKQYFGEDI